MVGDVASCMAADINEVHDGFTPVSLQQHAPPVPGVQHQVLQHALPLQGPTVDAPVLVQPGSGPGQQQVVPSPNSLPNPVAPSTTGYNLTGVKVT